MANSTNKRLAATVNVFSIQKPVESLCNPRRRWSRDVPFRARKSARRSRDVPFCAPEVGRGGHVMLRFAGRGGHVMLRFAGKRSSHVQEVRTREYSVVKQRVAEAVEESIRKVEKLTLEVDQRVKEAEEANRVIMTHSRNKEQPKQGRCVAVQEPEAHSTPYNAENEKKGRLHDS
ncbi:hypothetical protein chiPu_0024137, partial [Chiloscyllium punctatum]|nr:hypothetical protein [Chiloscyllium punctatum]